ncbi:glycine dehydrogenase [Pneumocystis murina B123]|uniref:Glycine cleavage system P protein n=1 Tax=Pneumocystis murina (strain B123) TaxID=1069680 RepID=M7NRF0_PNEMU|nr:glycine dehydrogenase [Pneumocystis murina B123]EMR09842.1 glycine dehydrogenase [Pneumocystis murina B123]
MQTLYKTGLIKKKIINKIFHGKSYIRISKSWTHNSIYKALDCLERRHLGVNGFKEENHLLKQIGLNDLDTFIKKTIPSNILINEKEIEDALGKELSESELVSRLRKLASKNRLIKSLIGMGYVGTNVPSVIQRNILENPAWYTSYTPYQPEISQGRLECLINYQTMISDLTELPISNASLLDEGTAASEAMTMVFSILKQKRKTFYVDINAHPQTIEVLKLRSSGYGINIVIGKPTKEKIEPLKNDIFGILLQYPDTFGGIHDYTSFSQYVHSFNAHIICAVDLLSLTLLQSPSQWGADIIVGSSQRFGIPMGFGGPHAAFIACNDLYKRKIPGRVVGISKDRRGKLAYRLALQTREQHIRREKATSNICTSQVLLAIMASLYAIYHGPIGLQNTAKRILSLTKILGEFIKKQGHCLYNEIYFDTLTIKLKNCNADQLLKKALSKKYNLRPIDEETIGITLDETVTEDDMKHLFDIFTISSYNLETPTSIAKKLNISIESPAMLPEKFQRKNEFLQHEIFNSYHTETEILRYIHHLQSKDLSLTCSMIPLGSCTMKLNATTEMLGVTWPEFNSLHPFVPSDQVEGYHMLIKDLENDLLSITGFNGCTFQPNSGASGEYTGLQIISKYHKENNQGHRNICLIPISAHGTNPASAVMAGMKVVPVKCDSNGNIQLDDLKMKAQLHKDNLAVFMVTYPSTYGVFEPYIVEALKIIHDFGGQVYLDGANMNAQIGLCSPGKIGIDICHLNLHKTFCIPHGGGGPGVGVCAMKDHLLDYIPGHPIVETGGKKAIPPVASAPWGSASILPISWAYIKMLGGKGLIRASKIALLNANYMASKLSKHYKILYTNSEGMCAHEFILDVREFKKLGIEAIDIAKRLQDYSFHAPTMSWPVVNTLMIEPTECESIAEMDRFCDALVSIRKEIKEIEEGKQPKGNNLLSNAPHPLDDFIFEEWNKPYTKEQAAYPLEYLKKRKFWPSTARIDDAWGDLNFFCSCEPPEGFFK